ncbi:MAG: cytochrome C [Gordonia sp.]|nr:cytochrome C [Gordonia sp. (in: high G+C Gram-positive bacteria)]
MPERSYDLLVIGAGMAGLTAAARAATEGRSVCVVEVAAEVGGSARFAGYAWTAPDRAVMAQHNPKGDPILRDALVDGFAGGIGWIRSVGVDVAEPQSILSFGQGHKFDTNHYVDTCKRVVLDSGGRLLLNTQTESLLTQAGDVLGARVTGEVGTVDIRAVSTLLATGGFQGNSDLLARYVHSDAGAMQVRSNLNSVGAGLRLAQHAGAAAGVDDAGFYGHLIPAGVAFADSGDFVDLSLYYSEHALLFNTAGHRFVDETLGDHLTTMALLDQPESRGLLIADERVHRDWMLASYVEGAVAVDKFALADKRGGRVGVAEDLSEFEYLPDDWGYDGPAIAEQIADFNRRAGGQAEVIPGRALDRQPLDEPPYYLIEAAPAITFPFYGVRIDAQARVLDSDGVPIKGLLAAGSDTGGLWNRAYAGGLATALVFGLAAAETALAA